MSALLRSSLVVPMLVVALLGGVLGFMVTRQLVPEGAEDGARVSVLALPSTPTPEPTPTPTPSPTPSATPRDGDGGGRGGGNGGGSGTCPANCTCEPLPPGGVRVVCRG